MCTVSWRYSGGTWPAGYELWFNRDESRRRPEAEPPAVHQGTAEGARFISPTDPVGGGTWLAANERGLAIGILNLYEAELFHQPERPVSRGQLVRNLAPLGDRRSVGSAIDRAVSEDGSRLRPFLLLLLGLEAKPKLWRWDGKALTGTSPSPPVTTSSYQTEEVTAFRRRAFTPDGPLEDFHRSQDPGREAFSVRMERPDARTVSISHIHVGDGEVVFRYFADPAEASPSHSVSLPLLQPVSNG